MFGEVEEKNMDGIHSATLLALEFPRVLAALAARTRTIYGKEKALTLEPVTDDETIIRWQEETVEIHTYIAKESTLPLDGLPDVIPALSRARLLDAVLPGKELIAFLLILESVRSIKRTIENETDFPRLRSLTYFMDPCPELLATLQRSLEPSGQVKDNASPELSRIRQSINSLREQIYHRLDAFLSRHEYKGMLQEELITMRNDRFVIPMKRESAGSIKGIIHGYSSSGATAFVEPLFLVTENNQLADLHSDEETEIERILRHLTGLVGVKHEELNANLTIIAHFDLLEAKARLADDLNCSRPGIAVDGVANLVNARHPILVLKHNAAYPADRKPVIPIDIFIGGRTRALVISGSNTGGKTVSLKTLGLLCLMYQAGLQIPASPDSTLPIFQHVWADIGDEQSIEQSVSTFSSHMANISRFVQGGLDRSLVLLDELGVGTDPRYGAAIAQAVLEAILDVEGCVVVTTHYDSLKQWAAQTRFAANASVLFDPRTNRPTYQLRLGSPGSSNALGIARLIGMPEHVLERAEMLVGEEQVELDALLSQAQEERLALVRLRQETEGDYRRIREEVEKLQDDRERLRRAAQKELDRARSELSMVIARAHNTVDAIIKAISAEETTKAEAKKKAKELQKLVTEMRTDLEIVAPGGILAPEPEVTAVLGIPLAAGDEVTVGHTGAKGVVQEVDHIKGRALVLLGAVRVMMDVTALRRVESGPEKKPARITRTETPEDAPSSELMLIGMRVDDALPLVDDLLDKAYRNGLAEVYLVHGKGTGRLRQAIREHLKTHGMVASYGDGPPNAGGSGMTVVRLETD